MRKFFQRSANKNSGNIRTARRVRSSKQGDVLKFESLDPRRLMAVAYDPVTDVINILGTERTDVVQISNAMMDGNAVIRVRDNGVNHVFPQSTMPVAGINASLLGGDDQISVQRYTPPDSWSGSDTFTYLFINTGSGNDMADLGIDYAGGPDPENSQPFVLDVKTESGDDMVRLDFGVGGIGTEVVSNIDTGNGNDVVRAKWHVPELASDCSSRIDTGAGNDDVQLDKTISGAGSHVQSQLLTGDGDDLIKVGTTVSGPDVEVMSSVFTGAGNDVFNWKLDCWRPTRQGTSKYTVELGDGNDTAVIDANFPSLGMGAMDVLMSIDGGAGNDDIQTNLRLGQANGTIGVIVRGGDGNDRLRLRTFGSGGDDLHTDLRIDGGAGFDTSWSTPDVIVSNVERRL